MKVAYNASHGGFSLSRVATLWLAANGLESAINYLSTYCNEPWQSNCYDPDDISRHSDLLIRCLEEVGLEAASGEMAVLRIAEVDDLYRIEDYDGYETVVQPHQIKWISALRDQ